MKMRISNDAFFYLLKKEEPLDEVNLIEAEKIVQMFPNGFTIVDNWRQVPYLGLISCELIEKLPKRPSINRRPKSIPKKLLNNKISESIPEELPNIKVDYAYDAFDSLTTEVQHHIKWLDNSHVRLWWHNHKKNTGRLRGDFEVKINKYHNQYFEVNNSIYFIKNFIAV